MKFQTSASQEFLSSRQKQQSKNMFTISDSRFKHIRNLESKNKSLTSKLLDLETDLEQIDEFKIAIQIDRQPNKSTRSLVFNQIDVKKGKIQLEPEQQNNDFHQQRVDILKAQLLKQQRYIKRLTTILQTTRKFYEDLKEYLKYFAQVLRTSNTNETYLMKEQPIIVDENPRRKSIPKLKETDYEDSFDRQQAMSKVNKITKDKELLDVAEKKQNYISLKNMLMQFKSNEDREGFVQTFQQIYTKIAEYERSNVNFKSLFESQRRLNGPNRLVYKHPIRDIIRQYGHYFPIKTIYSAFPMKDRERLEHFIYGLEGMSSQIQRDLVKVDTFWLFKSNPFFFQSKENKSLVELPVPILEEQQVFDQFLAEPEKHRVINLDQRMLSQVENDLLLLLDQLLELQHRHHEEFKELSYFQKPTFNTLQSQIRKSLESLVCISSMIGNTNLKTINKVYIVSNSDAYLYQHQVFSQNDFESKYQQLELLLGDLGDVVSTQELQIVKKAKIILKSVNNMYEISRMVTSIRESEINFLKQKLALILIDYDQVNLFTNAAEKKVKGFFNVISNKFQNVINQYNTVIEQDKLSDTNFRKQFGQQFKRNLKDILDFIQQDLSRKENSINIMQLQQEFDKQVSTFYVRCESLLRINEQIQKRMQQQSF